MGTEFSGVISAVPELGPGWDSGWLWSREAWELGQDWLTALVHVGLASSAGSASLSPVSFSENSKTRISHLTRLLGESNDTVNVKELHKL